MQERAFSFHQTHHEKDRHLMSTSCPLCFVLSSCCIYVFSLQLRGDKHFPYLYEANLVSFRPALCSRVIASNLQFCNDTKNRSTLSNYWHSWWLARTMESEMPLPPQGIDLQIEPCWIVESARSTWLKIDVTRKVERRDIVVRIQARVFVAMVFVCIPFFNHYENSSFSQKIPHSMHPTYEFSTCSM